MGNDYQTSHLVFLYCHGIWPKSEKKFVDHINKDKSDNRVENLRLVTHKENSRNCSKYSSNTSGVTGVREDSQRPGKFIAYITYNKQRYTRGPFATKEEAILKRKELEKKFGFTND